MMTFINQTSYLLVSAFALGVVALALLRRGTSALRLALLGGMALALLGAHLALRRAPTPAANAAFLRGERPTLVEFYSDY